MARETSHRKAVTINDASRTIIDGVPEEIVTDKPAPPAETGDKGKKVKGGDNVDTP